MEIFSNERSVLWLATGFYLLAALVAFAHMLGKQRQLPLVAYGLVWVAFLIQLTGLSIRGAAIHACPLGNPFEVIQFIVWSAVFLFLVTFPFARLNFLGGVLALMASILSTLSLGITAWDTPSTARLFGGNPWIELHASLAMFSYGLFGVLAIMATLFLVQQAALKRKASLTLFSALPSVRELDLFGFRLVVAGLMLLTFALTVGIFFWLREPDSTSLSKLIFTSFIWLGYLVLALARWRFDLAPKRFAQGVILLFVAAVLSIGPITNVRRSGDVQDLTHETR